jgi:hypothetical protein
MRAATCDRKETGFTAFASDSDEIDASFVGADSIAETGIAI